MVALLVITKIGFFFKEILTRTPYILLHLLFLEKISDLLCVTCPIPERKTLKGIQVFMSDMTL